MYRNIFKIHSWLGIISGVVLLIAGLSASVLLFKDELGRWFEPSLARGEPGSAVKPLDELLDGIRKRFPDSSISGIELDSLAYPGRALRVLLKWDEKHYPNQGRYVHVNSYTGQILGERWGHFLDWLYYLHFELLLGYWGRAVMSFFGLFLFLLGVSGLYLYRDWIRLLIHPIRTGGSLRLLLSDWHKLTGVSSLLFVVVLGFTGFYMNVRIIPYMFEQWRNRSAKESKTKPETLDRSPLTDVQVGPALDAAQIAAPKMTVRLVQLPVTKGDPIVFYGSEKGWRGVLFGNYACQVRMDPLDNKVLDVRDIAHMTFADAFLSIVATVHIGRYGGLPVRILYAAFGLMPGVLAVTGFWMFLERRKRRRFGL